MPMAILSHPATKRKIYLEKFFQQCQDNISNAYLNVVVGWGGIGIFYE